MPICRRWRRINALACAPTVVIVMIDDVGCYFASGRIEQMTIEIVPPQQSKQ